MTLPIRPPFPPMEAQSVDEIPTGPEWQYEPKWDGFRCLVFRDGSSVELQSKSGQPLTRYFPELVEAVRAVPAKAFVIDGEIVVPSDGAFSFDDLLQRIHPAQSRVQKLAVETPALLIVFDLLVDAQCGRNARRHHRQAARPSLSLRRPQRHAEDQELSQRGLRGRRLPLQ